MTAEYPADFDWPADLDLTQHAWLAAWADGHAPIHIAKCAVVRDADADEGRTVALVVDLPAPVDRDFHPFTVMEWPSTFGDMGGEYPVRYVIAIERPRLRSIVQAASAPKHRLALVEGSK